MKPIKSVVKTLLSCARIFVSREEPVNLYTHLRRVLQKLEINCVLDVGAYHGEFGKRLRDIGYRGKIISFEPVAAHFNVLAQQAARDPQWAVHQIALSDRDGEAEINLYDGTTFASLLVPNEYGKKAFTEKMRPVGKERIQTRRLEGLLDECLKGLAGPRVLLKTDCQGFDLQVIRGAGSKLAQIDALQCEVAVSPIYAEMSNSLLTMVPELLATGFRLTGAFPVSTDNDGLSLIELDCVLIRPRK
jgi:FkbM family methyltransferase